MKIRTQRLAEFLPAAMATRAECQLVPLPAGERAWPRTLTRPAERRSASKTAQAMMQCCASPIAPDASPAARPGRPASAAGGPACFHVGGRVKPTTDDSPPLESGSP
jgi:hypothetical protein